MEPLDWVKICDCDSETNARLYEAVLAEEGVRSLLTGLDVSALGEALDGPDLIQLHVQQSDESRARSLIDDLQSEDDQPVPAWTCQCGETVDEGFWVCWSCQATYDPQAETED